MGLRGDGVAADHAAGAVEGNVAVQEPDADVVGHHVCRDHLHGCDGNALAVGGGGEEDVALRRAHRKGRPERAVPVRPPARAPVMVAQHDHLRRAQDWIAAASGEWQDFKSKTRDGHVLETTWAIVRLSDGTTVCIGKDISDSKRAEEERKRLLQRLITAHEDERRHLSRELHDNIGQYLSALLLGLESCARLPQLPVAALAKLSYLKETTKRLELDVHGVALELRPTTLDDLGLEAALSSLTREWARRHEQRIRAVFNSTGFNNQAERLSSDVEVAIYRVVQEALTNVARHSHAEIVSVILTRDNRHVQVIIEDDGIGFDAENFMSGPIENRRLGLMGMQERVQLVGGEFKIESGAGTTIVVSIPLSRNGSAG